MTANTSSRSGVARLLAGAGLWALPGTMLATAPALAGSGQPSYKQLGFQEAATPIAEQIHWFHDYVNVIIFLISIFVLVLMLWVMWRFSEKRSPVPSRTTHNTVIEVLWTVVPVFILVIIAIPSFKLLYAQYTFPPADLTIKAIGNTWYWRHEFPDQGIGVDSVMLKSDKDESKDEIKAAIKSGMPPDQVPRNLAVNNEVLVPVNKVVHVLVTSNDVIHSWTIPSFGVKVDAVHGRDTATWFKATREGIFFGQCSELCGRDHAFMPIAIRVVSEDVFKQWVEATKKRDRQKVRDLILKQAKEHSKVASERSGREKLAAR
jgi:cytochrome c oxidase subunit 2